MIRCIKRSPEYWLVRRRLANAWPSDVWTDGEYGITFATFELSRRFDHRDDADFAAAVFVIRLDTATLMGAHTVELGAGAITTIVTPIDKTMVHELRDPL